MSKIYEVNTASPTNSTRLVRADSQAQVRRHIQKPIEISVVDTERALDLVQNKGVIIETAE